MPKTSQSKTAEILARVAELEERVLALEQRIAVSVSSDDLRRSGLRRCGGCGAWVNTSIGTHRCPGRRVLR